MNQRDLIIPTTFMTPEEIAFVQGHLGDSGLLNYAQARFSAQHAFALNRQRSTTLPANMRSLCLDIRETASIALQHIEAGCVPADWMGDNVAIAIDRLTGQLSYRTWGWVKEKLRALTQMNIPEPIRQPQP